MSRQARLLIIWAVSSFIAAFMAMHLSDAAFEQQTGTWVPAGNDSFYHARRIIDAATTTGKLAEFDAQIHAPQGSWITWPWAYDWSMAQALKGWLALNPDSQPMAFLAWVPVVWVFINAGLLLGICIAARLATPWTAVVMLGYALSPLTMLLHGVGIIDHHFIAHTFVLATILAGLIFFRTGSSAGGTALGITLGLAPAFHTGEFILQAPVLLTIAILWLRRALPPVNALTALSSALIITTLLALLPSAAFQDGQFQYSVFSWFHLYIASATTLLISCLARFRVSKRRIAALCLVCVALLTPIWGDAINGAAFISGGMLPLERMAEARSPVFLAQQPGGAIDMLASYSLFALASPLLIFIWLWRGWRTHQAAELFVAVMIVFGVSLMLMQFRLHYFGSFAIVLGFALLFKQKQSSSDRTFRLAFGGSCVLLALSAYAGYSNNIKVNHPLGLDPAYADLFTLINDASVACEQTSGIIFSDSNLGNYLRYHTDCSIIANSFRITPLHAQKILATHTLLELTPEEFLRQAPPDTRYVLAYLREFVRSENGAAALASTEDIQRSNPRLFFALNASDTLPDRFQLISELPLGPDRSLTRARLFRILPEQNL